MEGSSESEDTTYSESSSSSSRSSDEDQPRRIIAKKSPILLQTKTFSVTRAPITRKISKKDRFYDKSRDIPNDVYFGDVKGEIVQLNIMQSLQLKLLLLTVPLHVLHTRWDSDAESDSDHSERIIKSSSSSSRYSSQGTNFGSRMK